MSSSQFLTDRTENSTPTTGCTNAVDSIVNQATSTENQKLDKITNTIEIQQQQFTNIITALTELTENLEKTHYPQTNPQYQPTILSESQQQKQLHRGVPRKRCSENMQQIYRRTPMPKCDFNKVALQLY